VNAGVGNYSAGHNCSRKVPFYVLAQESSSGNVLAVRDTHLPAPASLICRVTTYLGNHERSRNFKGVRKLGKSDGKHVCEEH